VTDQIGGVILYSGGDWMGDFGDVNMSVVAFYDGHAAYTRLEPYDGTDSNGFGEEYQAIFSKGRVMLP